MEISDDHSGRTGSWLTDYLHVHAERLDPNSDLILMEYCG